MMVPVGRLTLVRTFEKSEFIRAMSFVAIPGLIGPMLGPIAASLHLRRSRATASDYRPARRLAHPRRHGRPRPTVLSVDLERPGAASLLAAEFNARGLEPANVVNNAGFGLVGQAARLDRNEQLAPQAAGLAVGPGSTLT